MAFKVLTIECLVNCLSDAVTARIKRFDGLFFDPASETFKPLAYFSTPTSCLIQLTLGTNLDQWLASVNISLNTAQFVDGDYVIYFYDQALKCFDGSKISIYAGDSHNPNPTDIALRMMNAQAGKGTFRDAAIKINVT